LPPEITKTNRGRDVPMNDEMVEMLRQHWENRPSDYYVFTCKGQPIIEINKNSEQTD